MKTYTIEIGKLNATKGWNNIDWEREVEMTEQELTLAVQGSNAIEVYKNEWHYTQSTTKETIAFRIKQA